MTAFLFRSELNVGVDGSSFSLVKHRRPSYGPDANQLIFVSGKTGRDEGGMEGGREERKDRGGGVKMEDGSSFSLLKYRGPLHGLDTHRLIFLSKGTTSNDLGGGGNREKKI